jgi:hypothetical protein
MINVEHDRAAAARLGPPHQRGKISPVTLKEFSWLICDLIARS